MKLTHGPLTVLLLVAAACSGGGGASAGSTGNLGQDLQVVLDTTTSSGATLDAQVDLVVLERADGSFTDNVLPAPVALRLVDPTGRPATLRLTNVPRGTYQAARLLFHGDGARLRTSDDKLWSVTCEPVDDRVLFDELHTHEIGDDRFLAMRHHGEPEIGDDGRGGRRWRPDFSGRSGTAQPLGLAEFKVRTIAPAEGTFTAEMHAHGGELMVTVQVPESATLYGKTGAKVDRAGFFGLLVAGAEVKATGTLGAGMVFTVDVARLDDGRIEGGAGGQPESEGSVGEIRAATGELVMLPRGDDPLIVAGKSVTSQLVRIPATTRIQDARNADQTIPLASVQAGWRIWVRGTLAGDGALVATWVRVRP